MDREYGAQYADLYHRHWWWRARESYLKGVLGGIIAPGAAGRVLDFGCGNGLFLSALARYGEPWGIETDAALVDPKGEWRHRIRTEPLMPDPSEHAQYGLVVALDVLEHITDPVPVMTELARRLKGGGWFVATVPAFQELWTAHDDLNHHVRRYRLSELESLVRNAGLEVVDSRYFFAWLAALKWVVALKERIVQPAPSSPQVPWAPVNALVHRWSLFEQKLWGTSKPPVGSSALIIARAPR